MYIVYVPLNQIQRQSAYRKDLINAKREIIICSPYISSAGIDILIRDRVSMIQKDVYVKIITLAPSCYSKDYKGRIEQLHIKVRSAGIDLQLSEQLSSKYSVIDKEILWYGSMNLISNIKEDDDEMRIVNKDVARAILE